MIGNRHVSRDASVGASHEEVRGRESEGIPEISFNTAIISPEQNEKGVWQISIQRVLLDGEDSRAADRFANWLSNATILDHHSLVYDAGLSREDIEAKQKELVTFLDHKKEELYRVYLLLDEVDSFVKALQQ